MAYTPLDFKTIQANATEIQRRQRRAKELRNQQEGYKKLAATPGEGRHYAPTQQGGLYETVAQYHKDYSGAGNKIAGMLGNWLTGGQAETAETEAEKMRNEEVLRAVQQHSDPNAPAMVGPKDLNEALGIQPAPPAPAAAPIQGMGKGLAAAGAPPPPELGSAGVPQLPSGPPADLMASLGMQDAGTGAVAGMEAALPQEAAPTKETLRAYLGLIGGPDMNLDDILPKAGTVKVQSRDRGKDGMIWYNMSDGTKRNSGIEFDTSVELIHDTDPASPTYRRYIPVSKWSSGHQGQQPPEDAERKWVKAGEVDEGLLPGEEGEDSTTYAPAPEGNGGQRATTEGGTQADSTFPDLPVESNQNIAKLAATLQGMGWPQDRIDQAVNDQYGMEKEKLGIKVTPDTAGAEAAPPVPPAGAAPPAPVAPVAPPPAAAAAPPLAPAPAPTEQITPYLTGQPASAIPAPRPVPARPQAPARRGMVPTTVAPLTPAEMKGQEVRETELAKHEMALISAETQAIIESAKTTGIELSKDQVQRYTGAKAARAKFDTVLRAPRLALDKLVSPDGTMHPGLKGLSSKSLTGWLAQDKDSIYQRRMLATADPEAAQALALLETIAGGNFVQGFNTIAGMGAGSIDKNEGVQLQTSIGNLSTARRPEDIAQSLVEIREGQNRSMAALDATIAEGPNYRPGAGGAKKPRTREQIMEDIRRRRGG